MELLFPSTDDASERIFLHVPSTHEKGERRSRPKNLANSCYLLRVQRFFLLLLHIFDVFDLLVIIIISMNFY